MSNSQVLFSTTTVTSEVTVESQSAPSSYVSGNTNSSTSTLNVAAQQTSSSSLTSTTPSPSPTISSSAVATSTAAVSSDLSSPSVSSDTSVTSSASVSFSSQVSSSTSTVPTTSQSSAAAQPTASTSPASASSPGSNGNTTNTETVTSTETLSSTTTLINTITSVPDVSLTSLTTSEVQSATISITQANTTGAVHTSLETSGHTSALPFPTPVFNATSTLSLVQTSTLTGAGPTATANVTTIQAGNIFVAIQTDAPPSQVTSRGDHPVPTLGIQQQQERLQTNKFYANFFLGDQTAGTWTHPYSVAWSKGAGETDSWGLAVSHIERDQLAGSGSRNPSLDAGDVGFFAAPVGIQSMVLSAAELDANSTLTTDSLTSFSVNVNLMARGAQNPTITFPLVQGMAFITGSYGGGTPMLQSGIGITNLTYAGAVVGNTTYKYRASLHDGFDWLIYVTPANAFYNENSFTLLTTGEIQGPSGFGGHIQLAKVPANSTDAENVYDASAGAYPTTASISGSVSGTSGSYSISWTKAGVTSQQLLMFALPHHMESLAYESSGGITDVQLITTTKGMATAIRGDSWTLDEPNLPIDMSFAPWSPELGSVVSVSAAAEDAINAAGYAELSQNISQQTNVGSLYYDGKALAKFATIIYTVNDIANNKTLALTGLALLETAFALHVNNQMQIPLVYDTVWGGAVSAGSYNGGSSGVDFGNTYYNDHHFHYGYFVYAAAVIGYMRPAWLSEGSNAAWTNMLVRDYANSVTDDEFFPFQRMFDWYHGHSWAHGLIETADGKDQESSSEDTMASYAVKMWGRISGDVNMEARGNLMLSVQQRSLQHYYLYLGNNTVEPADFIGNKVAGILFENKIDHTTYFGAEPEYIQGIHMLPQMPCSTLTRSKEFVQQEWDAYFGPQGIKPVEQVGGGWRGILMANLATIDPVSSYNFFSNASGDFSVDYLDGGASQTWYLAWSAALGGSQAGSGKVRRGAAEGQGRRRTATAADEKMRVGQEL
ncbi:endo-1,3-beta glucanase [Friedmanniomyces endolithicus]|uniref:glucan endo-1,3-beta-D-glucosidase n=1 Tax=Rachicladosporium monterosium TaxID=1507873 RepID=A0ABR0LA63_9PEZI|nr:endo-1,3-beta glucanase [Friedmanniomyces endolithicus]KAK1813737.1 endo-1,3-beta glucanase [Friedmanniomyces endolithicus]KAK5145238.1 endo-1,3-beta glucanase [Rachicladosporium monterosium]